MANAHLPNSDPRVTPDWREPPFPRTSFIDHIRTTQVDGFNGTRYSGFVPPDWCARGGQSLSAFGGFCAGTLLMTAQQYGRQYGDQNNFDPIHINIEFLNPMPQGDFHVAVKELRSGNSSRVIQAELVSPGTESIIYSSAIVRLGVLEETGHKKSLQPNFGPMPDREAECGRWAHALFYAFNPPSASVRSFCPNDGDNILWSPRYGGQHTRCHWYKLDDGTLFQSEHIAMLVDLVWQSKHSQLSDLLTYHTLDSGYSVQLRKKRLDSCNELFDANFVSLDRV